ncbi:MAG TPA: maleylpyruvate isomerase family mycothiol-dependent enzyme [Streptosporangiaceae bacterium]|nr:maleylpyruvate isomerase family mycothiol-dependent enzyme [Streptosporangiaceae bacterium]
MTDSTAAGAGLDQPGLDQQGVDQQGVDKDRLIDLLGAEWSSIALLLADLSADAWSTTVLPGWDVHDVLAHMVGTEYALSGKTLPPVPDDADGFEHVRNDIGKVNEAWVVSLRSLPHSELLAEFNRITAERLTSLRAMSVEDFYAPSWTPAGPGTYARFMQIRVFDCWMHEQDIRSAVGRPGHESGAAAERSLDEVVGALGYIIGKLGRAPDGSAVLIRLTGPIERDLHVIVEGRARVADALDGEPTAMITLSSSLFLRLAGGREAPETSPESIRLDGDVDLARRLASNFAFTI